MMKITVAVSSEALHRNTSEDVFLLKVKNGFFDTPLEICIDGTAYTGKVISDEDDGLQREITIRVNSSIAGFTPGPHT